VVSPSPFHLRNREHLAVVGCSSAVIHWDSPKLKGFIAWLLWGVAHVYLLVRFHNRFLVTMRWLWIYLTFQRRARLIAEDVSRDKHTNKEKAGAAEKEPGASRGLGTPRVHG
jgi:NADH dehydrogenase